MAEAQNFKRIQAHKSGPYDFENIQFGQVGHSYNFDNKIFYLHSCYERRRKIKQKYKIEFIT